MSSNITNELEKAKELIQKKLSLIEQMESGDLEILKNCGIEYERFSKHFTIAEEILRHHNDLLAFKELNELGEDCIQDIDLAEQELETSVTQLQALYSEKSTSPNSVTIEIKPGVGGEEAEIFACDLLNMYRRYANFKKWAWEVLKLQHTGKDQIKEASIKISGPGAFDFMTLEGGVHRVQRIPTTDSMDRIQTSTAVVCALPEDEEIEVELNKKDLRIIACRGGGPGGQSVNTTESAVSVLHIPTGIEVSLQDERSQTQNREKALAEVKARVMALRESQKNAERNQLRSTQSKDGDRSDKTRTYNYPQNRVTDHARKITLQNLDRVMDGEEMLDKFAAAIKAAHDAQPKPEKSL